LFSTFLSLLFVPAAAIWVDRLERMVLVFLRIRHGGETEIAPVNAR